MDHQTPLKVVRLLIVNLNRCAPPPPVAYDGYNAELCCTTEQRRIAWCKSCIAVSNSLMFTYKYMTRKVFLQRCGMTENEIERYIGK